MVMDGQRKKNVHDGHRERLRRRFLDHGLAPFADHEVLELLLFYIIERRDTNPIAHRLIEQFGTLEAVLAAAPEQLAKVEGIGKQSALFLNLVGQTGRRCRLAALDREPVILSSTEAAGAYLLERFAGERLEVAYQLCLDAKGKVLDCRRLTEGDASSAELPIRRVVEFALRYNASAVILAHNHPSGLAVPSREDVLATTQIESALRAIGVVLADHIIVADGDFVSMAQNGTLRHRAGW